MTRLHVAFLALLVTACSSKPPPAPPADAGLEDAREVPDPDADLPIEPLDDASPLCLPNGGQACVTDADCPPAKGCPFYFTCETLPDRTRRCVHHALDGGP